MADPLIDRAADSFAATLVEWRGERRLSQKQLAAEMGFDPSYVSHVERRRHPPSEDFARRAEAVLHSSGAIWQRFRDYVAARQAGSVSTTYRSPREVVLPSQRMPVASGLIVEHENSRLSYVDGVYHCVISRELYNAGHEPVTRYLVRIGVDRYPGDPEQSNQHYRDHPLTWAELNIDARCGDETMRWRPKLDRDALKEVWLLFENDEGRFPIYPGQRCTIEYSYACGEDKWGNWFQRAVRLPTRRLSVQIDFPSELRSVMWGVETSLTAEAGPLKTPLTQRSDGGRTHFEWSIDEPSLNTRFRLEWRFRKDETPVTTAAPSLINSGRRPSRRMRMEGIVQRGAPMLVRPARWFDLPDQGELARGIVERLRGSLQRVVEMHEFAKGAGLSAPQVGIGWAAAVVRTPADDGEPLVLLNPRVVAESVEQDEQYEGCLSLFDVRGRVTRPMLIEVEHCDLEGVQTTTTFTAGLARLVAHEIDHLNGLLYPDRMPPEGRLIPVEEYHEHGQPWRY